MAKLSTALKNGLFSTNTVSSLLGPYFIYFYDGPVPATADAAIDIASRLLCKMAANTGGTTGGTWAAAAGGAMPKTAAETLDGLVLASGTPTFFRICVGSDDGSGAAGGSDYRWQDTAGGPGKAIEFTDPVFVANGTNRRGLNQLSLQVP